MNEPAMAPQEHKPYPPKMADQVDTILEDLESELELMADETFEGLKLASREGRADGLKKLKAHIALLRVKKGENRKKSYAVLNKSHLMTLLELRWLRSMINDGSPELDTTPVTNWPEVLEHAKGSLWAIFRKEQAEDKNSLAGQIDQLAKFILKEVPGEPARSEGAVETIIRHVKGTRNSLMASGDTIDQIDRFLVSRGLVDEFKKYRSPLPDDPETGNLNNPMDGMSGPGTCNCADISTVGHRVGCPTHGQMGQ